MYEKNLEKAREINRKLIRKMHEVCRKYHITYYCDSGFLLGAVRSQSFIPWDDDVDIAFKREEYKKLLQVPKEEWGEDFLFVPYDELARGYFFDYTTRLVYLKDTVPQHTYEKASKHCNSEIINKMGLDCFILDNAYDSNWRQKLLELHLVILYGMSMGHREYMDYSEYPFFKRIFIFLLACIGKCVPMDVIYKKYDQVSSSGDRNSNRVFYSNYGVNDLNVICEKKWFQSTVSLKVDEDLFDGPIDYDKILKNLYGDYMQLPPAEQRIPMHILEDSY